MGHVAAGTCEPGWKDTPRGFSPRVCRCPSGALGGLAPRASRPPDEQPPGARSCTAREAARGPPTNSSKLLQELSGETDRLPSDKSLGPSCE